MQNLCGLRFALLQGFGTSVLFIARVVGEVIDGVVEAFEGGQEVPEGEGKGLSRLLKCFVGMREKDGLVALSNQMVYVCRRDVGVLCGSVYTNTDGICNKLG